MKKSESIYEIMKNGQMDVNHNFNTVRLDLPGWVCEVDGKLDGKEELLGWAEKHEVTLALMQKGLQAMLIDMRAKCRPADKKKVKQPLVREEAQKRLDEYVLSELKRGRKVSERDKMRQVMEAAGLGEDKIMLVLAKMGEVG